MRYVADHPLTPFGRFTELVQQDHENERAEASAKEQMESAEVQVDRAFSGRLTP